MILALVCNIALAVADVFYLFLLVVHLAGYALAIIGLSASLPKWLRRITAVPSYLLVSYAAFATAVFKFLRGDLMATWRPRSG